MKLFTNIRLKIINIALALVLPIILGVLLYQAKIAQGPFHIFHHSDPSYVYLFNSVNLNYGYVPGHIDHPGTILQYLGAVVIRLTYWVSGTKTTIIEDVVAQPEKYLSILSNVIIVFNVLAFFAIALLADRCFKKVWIGIYLQLIPLFFVDISVFYIYKIMAESMLWIFATYLAFLCIIFWFKKTEATNQNKYIFALSLVVALGITTKLTFIPFAIIPLFLIQNNRKKGYYVLITVLLFILMALPALFSYKYIFDWISNLLIHSGHYGTGKADVVLSANAFLADLTTTISYLLFPIIMVVISGVIWLFKYQKLRQNNILLNKKILLFFLCFFLMLIVNSSLVAKHYDPRYLSIIICFSFGILPVFYLFLQEVFKDKLVIQRLINSLCIIFMIVGVLYSTHTFNDNIVILEQNKQKRTELNNKILKAKEDKAIVIYYYANSSPMFALAFGTSYYAAMLKDTYGYYAHKLNPDMIEWNVTNNKCYVWNIPIPIAKIIEQKKRILLQGSILPESYKNTIKIRNSDTDEIQFPVKLIFDNQSGECIYELLY